MLKTSKTADRLIKQHGEAAPYVAAERALEMEKAGDGESQQHWANIVIETKVLLARDYGW
jgi:hypothetical protein